MKRSAPLRRHTPLAPVNRKRRQSEWQRAYGSKARVAFVKALPCVVCGATPSDNVHAFGDGAGRKAGYEAVLPLCRTCHRRLHRMGVESFQFAYAVNLAWHAQRTADAWNALQPAPRCELCGDECVGKSATTFAEYGLCTTCLTGKHRRSA